jgi:hypothetical protein
LHTPKLTETRTFRLDTSTLEAFDKLAQARGISPNALMNQQLNTILKFDRYFGELQIVKLASSTFRRILEAVPDRDLVKAGISAGSDIGPSIIRGTFASDSIESICEYIKAVSDLTNLFTTKDVQKAGKRVMTLRHSLGPKFSLWEANYLASTFKSLGSSPKISFTDSSIAIEISTGDISKTHKY